MFAIQLVGAQTAQGSNEDRDAQTHLKSHFGKETCFPSEYVKAGMESLIVEDFEFVEAGHHRDADQLMRKQQTVQAMVALR